MKRRVSVILGTRPEAVKLAPVILALRADQAFDCHVCATAQHREMLDQVLTVFGIVPDTMMKLNGLIVVPVALGLSIFSPWVMRMYGTDYGHSWLTLVAAGWTGAIMGIITPVGDVMAASGRMWLGVIKNA